MRWYEYRMQVDDLHAPDELKAKLLAMQPGGAAAAAAPARKKAVHFPAKRALGIAACAAVCVVGVYGAMNFGWLVGAGSSGASASSTATYSLARSSIDAGNGLESYALDTADLASEVSGSSGTGSTLTSSEAEANQNGSTQEAKIIYTADLTLEAKDYDAARAAIEQALSAAGGYMQGSDEYTYTEDTRHMYLTLRVPEENYESFLAAVAAIGNVTYKSQQAEDVTANYIDIQTRLENLEAQRTRLQQLQAQAETLSDLLEIESSLTDVQSQIESWQSQLDWYDDQVSCCTVSVTLNEVQEYTPDAKNFGESFLAALASGWANFVSGVQSVAVWLAGAWPVVVIVVAVVVVVVVRRKKRR